MKLKEIASRIAVHLKKFEGDPTLNLIVRSDGTKVSLCFMPNSWSGGRFVYVVYISYQGSSRLTKEEALKYLSWLDAGNVGRHHKCLK
jgi:hypothetical protein